MNSIIKYTINIALLFLCLANEAIAQNFGCYDVNQEYINFRRDAAQIKGGLIQNFRDIDWKNFTTDSNASDGYCVVYKYDYVSCRREIQMEGQIEYGLQQGLWKFYLNQSCLVKGPFINGKKEGLWTGNYIDVDGDTSYLARFHFSKDILHGLTSYYFPTGRLQKTINYRNGIKHGPEIEYFENDSSDIDLLRSRSQYHDGKLHGVYIRYYFSNPKDTSEYGTYLFGKRNGKFIFHHYGRMIANFKEDKLEGKTIKYYSNGILAYEMEFRNNLPYNLIQINDTSGQLIESNTLKEGNGRLNSYFLNGTLRSSFEYKNQMISGKIYHYSESGKIREKGDIYSKSVGHSMDPPDIALCDDLNLFTAWQLEFTEGTKLTSYDEHGSIRSIIHSVYNDALQDDLIYSRKFYDGQLSYEGTRWRGLEYGVEKRYDENGCIEMIGNQIIIGDGRKHSVRDGEFIFYYPFGAIKARIHYTRGKETGRSLFYDEDGTLIRTKVYEKNGEVYNIFLGDTLNRVDEHGRKQGKWITLPYCGNAESNTVPTVCEHYRDGLPFGVWKYYHIDGVSLWKTIRWKDSVNAFYQRWHPKDYLREEGYLFKQRRHGEWKEYDFRKGYLKYKGHYDCGQKEGIWQRFRKNGKLKREIVYSNGRIKNKP